MPRPKIAIIKLGALGDVVRTTSLLRPLHRDYPDAEIWWFTRSSAFPLLERNTLISKLVAVQGPITLPETDRSFDLVISLDEEQDAAQLSSHLTTKNRVGTSVTPDGRVTYSNSSRRWFEMSLLNRDSDGTLTTANGLKKANVYTYPQILMEMTGLQNVSKEDREPVIVTDPNEERWAADFRQKKIPANHRVIGINTGSGARWINKQLTLPKTFEVLAALGKRPNTTLLLLGGPEEKERNRAILASSPVPIVDGGTENSMTRFISIVNLCDDLVTSDSLALHIGSALGKKVLAFFGPTTAIEIECYRNSEHWLPTTPCRCFYLNRCRETQFCLDSLYTEWLVKQIAQS